MRTRIIAILSIVLISLIAIPSYTAMPGGIGSAAENGCTCHGGASSNTQVLVDGLPEVFNASETYSFTITVVNDELTRAADDNGRMGGFRIVSNGGMVSSTNDALSHEMDGALTHTVEANTVRQWAFEWTAPADSEAVVDFTIYGNAVNGGDSSGGDQWNKFTMTSMGSDAGAVAPSARSLVVLVTSIGLSLSMIVVGLMWVFYNRSPETFTIGKFIAYIKPWLTTTDHKQVGILYFLFGFFFFLVGGVLALLFRIQLALPENNFLT